MFRFEGLGFKAYSWEFRHGFEGLRGFRASGLKV